MNRPPAFSGEGAVAVDAGYKWPPRRLVGFAVFVALLTVAFCRPLFSLVSYALHSDLHSHVVLVPFIWIYLLYILRDQFPKTYCSSIGWAIFPSLGGTALLAGALTTNTPQQASIALSFVCFIVAGGFLFLGKKWMKAAMFPFAFLLFMVPLPDAVVDWLEEASKLGSTESANFFLHLTGMPVLRDGTVFQLPNIAIEVAQECSGIRSSWVLFIASTLAAYLFLRRPSNRLVLILAAIPLGILRNGARITTIALLCVHFGPHMIHSPIHRRGGPLFFALSLIPLFLVLWLLRRNERRRELRQLESDIRHKPL